MSSSCGAGAEYEHAQLVFRIKAVQRESENTRMEWQSYCDSSGAGTRDPKLHSGPFLQTFFELRAAGNLPVGPTPLYKSPMPGPDADPDEARAVLMEKVKHGQRASRVFKEAWRAFCLQTSHCTQDPARHESASLVRFLAHFSSEGGRVQGMPLHFAAQAPALWQPPSQQPGRPMLAKQQVLQEPMPEPAGAARGATLVHSLPSCSANGGTWDAGLYGIHQLAHNVPSDGGSECSTVDTLEPPGLLAGPPAEFVPMATKLVSGSYICL